jgi:predicted CoA-binding protein
MNIAIIGASKDKTKFGNKALRAYLKQPDTNVFPVNPNEREIENVKCYSSVLEIPVQIDVVSLYIPPEIGIKIIEDLVKKGVKKVFLNPGTESDEIIKELKMYDITPAITCSIKAIGIDPSTL